MTCSQTNTGSPAQGGLPASLSMELQPRAQKLGGQATLLIGAAPHLWIKVEASMCRLSPRSASDRPLVDVDHG